MDAAFAAWPDPSSLPSSAGASLPESFFARDTRQVARDLLGKILLSRAGGIIVGGRIVETEAYLGSDDAGSHAATKGPTKRNTVMFGPPAHAYVYFTYGNHHMLNFVTESDGVAGAVLIRAIEPLVGIDEMCRRRAGRSDRELTNGPGKLAAALGLDLSDNAGRLGAGNLVVYVAQEVASEEVAISGRIGLSAGHELPYRYFLEASPYVSKGRTGLPHRRTRMNRSTGGGRK